MTAHRDATAARVARTTAALLLVAVLAGCGRRHVATTGPPPGHARFVNSPDGLTGTLAAHSLDFSFDYPAGCEVLRQGRGNRWQC